MPSVIVFQVVQNVPVSTLVKIIVILHVFKLTSQLLIGLGVDKLSSSKQQVLILTLNLFQLFAHLCKLSPHYKCRQTHLLIGIGLAQRECILLMLFSALNKSDMLKMHLCCLLQKQSSYMILNFIYSVKLGPIKGAYSVSIEHGADTTSQ